jgi:peptidoglycan/xylan/chitin deacetylase (PgdA/CDA1 family)
MRTAFAALCTIGWAIGSAQAQCPDNPSALGTARVIAVAPAEHGRVGTLQYAETLPLEDHEVVLTFDDGPIPHTTIRILDMLAAECVKATFFSVGMMAHAAPQVLQRAAADGHTIGTHTQTHPLRMDRLPIDRARAEIDTGIASVKAALGDSAAVAPFMRIPGLGRTAAIEAYAASAGLMVWSGDFGADDWKRIGPDEVRARALAAIEHKGRGILVLHDTHERTVAALPGLLDELKRRRYHIVHVVPAGPEQPKTATTVEQWAARGKLLGPR